MKEEQKEETWEEREKRIKRFTAHLRRLASEEREEREDRAALAALRTGLGARPGTAAQQHRYVSSFLAERTHRSDKWFYYVGALFAWHPMSARGERSFGASFRELRQKQGTSDSIEKRFVALLASDERDLHLHLRQAVGLLRANNIPIHWYTLLADLTLRGWNRADRKVQSKWARDYYRTPSSLPSDDSSTSETSAE